MFAEENARGRFATSVSAVRRRETRAAKQQTHRVNNRSACSQQPHSSKLQGDICLSSRIPVLTMTERSVHRETPKAQRPAPRSTYVTNSGTLAHSGTYPHVSLAPHPPRANPSPTALAATVLPTAELTSPPCYQAIPAARRARRATSPSLPRTKLTSPPCLGPGPQTPTRPSPKHQQDRGPKHHTTEHGLFFRKARFFDKRAS